MIKKIILQLLISIMIIFILTAAFTLIIVNINKNKPEREDKLYEVNTVHEGLVQTMVYYLIKPILESALDRYIEKNGLVEHLKEMQQHTEVNSVNFYEIAEGNGNKALCGQKVSLMMRKISNVNIASFQDSEVTLEIGKDKLKDVGLGIIGMKEGGERVVLINDNKKGINSYYVKLIEVKDKYPDSISNLMIFDNLTNRAGKKVNCGDEISVKYSIRKYNGELLVENKTVQFKIGNRKVPLTIELGVIGMRAGNNRTIISPPDALAFDDDMLIQDLNLDEKNISIIDLSL